MSHPILSSFVAQGGPKLLYHAPASEKYANYVKCMACLQFNWCAPCSEMVGRTYVDVYENRIEYGWPFAFCCCCTCDQTTTVFLDRPVATKAAKAGCCTPMCTHCQFFPTCCDCCGEAVVIYGAGMCTTRKVAEAGVSNCGLPRGWMMFCGIDNADELARQIVAARQALLQRLGSGGQPASYNQVKPADEEMKR